MSSCVHSGLAQANFILNGAKEPSEEILQSWGIPELPDKNLMIINNREKMMSKDDNNKRQTEETFQIGPRYDLTKQNPDFQFFPVPGNQGKIGSCTAWALCHGLKSYQEAQDIGYSIDDSPSKVFNPIFLYSITAKDNQDCKEGVYLRDALENLKKFGAAPLSILPYKPDLCNETPSDIVREQAKRNRIIEYYTLKKEGIFFKVIDTDKVKQNIYNGLPVVIAMEIDDKWKDSSELSNYKSSIEYVWRSFSYKVGYHAMLCVGYDDTIGAFKVLNSFGENWVNNGYIWIDYKLFQKYVHEAYVTHDLRNLHRNPSFEKLLKKSKDILSVETSANLLLAEGFLKENRYVDVKDYRIQCQSISDDKQFAIIQIAQNEEEPNPIATIEVKIGGSSESFIYGEKLFEISADELIGSNKLNNMKTHVELKIRKD